MSDFSQNDQELLRSFVSSKDERAFAELVKRHQGMMQAVAFRVCGDTHDAMDAMQRALIAFARRAGEIHAEPSVGPWLHRAATLEAMAVRRQRIKRATKERVAMEQKQIEAEGIPAEAAFELDEAINSLSGKDREAIVLHYLEKNTFRAIAKKHGGTEAAWQKRGVRALKKLSGILQRRGVVTSVTVLGTWLAASSPAKAAVPASVMTQMLHEALRQQVALGASTQASSTLLMIMKLKTTIAICFVGGAFISYGWSERDSFSNIQEEALNASSPRPSRLDRSSRTDRGFDFERVASAINAYDSLGEKDSYAESRLRALMFSVPESYFDSVRSLFEDVGNPDRFGEIVACFYARWAEIDPESAWQRALTETSFLQSARRGVMVTWLNMDSETALTAMMKDRSDEEDLLILDEFVKIKVQHQPREAAKLIDRLAELWPRADRRLFEDVARTWAFNDPDPAGEWVATYWDRDIRNEFLKRFAWRVGHKDYRTGFRMADRIDDPPLRQRARCSALQWGMRTALPEVLGNPELNIRPGFPDDWNLIEVTAFAEGAMRNYSKRYSEIVAVAKNEAERQAIYRGAIEGAAYSLPEEVVAAVENVDSSFINQEAGKNTISAFMVRWAERDAEAATTWLASQPDNPKTALMRQALLEHSTESK